MNQPVLILFRHGNTFTAGQTPVWVGARTDMPLTAQGEAQAYAAASFVRQHHRLPGAVIAGPLQRTRLFAGIVAEAASTSVLVDERLREIDYGLWEGLSSDEINQRFGFLTLEAWEKNNQWPEDMKWSPPLEDLQKNLGAFLQEQHDKLKPGSAARLAVTSNGILRLIHQLITGDAADSTAKVKPGHFCIVKPQASGWHIETWNAKPE